MDAIAQISERHREIRILLGQVADSAEQPGSARGHLFIRFIHLMAIDTGVAEEILYPELERYQEMEQHVWNGYDDRHIIDRQVDDLARIDCSTVLWTKKAQVLKATVEERFADEERGLLAFLIRVCDSVRLAAIAEEMRRRTLAIASRLAELSHDASTWTIATRRHLCRLPCGAR
jgi:hypothetical protein